MSDFYVTLPSHSSKNDFPNNQANHFKIRLPHPVRLEGSGWKVGLSSIALPDAEVTVPLLTAIKDDDDVSTVLFKSKWLRMELGASMGHTTGDANFDSVDLKQVFSNVNEIRFMKSMIAFFEQRPIYNNGGPKFGSQYVTGDGKTNYVKFKWEGDELVMDNKDIDRPVANPPAFHVNVELAKKMGWIRWRKNYKHYELGPNIVQEFFDERIPILTNTNNDVFDEAGNPTFWTVVDGFLQLSIFCNWRFLNLDKAFEVVVGSSSRSLFIYSDVGGSSVVGNQVTDLLREINFIRRGAGSQYFEPLHIQKFRYARRS